MIRSAARPFLSVRRPAWSTSVGKSLAGSGYAPSRNEVTNTFYSSKRLMSSTPSEGSLSATLPGFGSDAISFESDAKTAASDPSITAAVEQLAAFEPTWWPSDQALVLINWVNETAGFPCYAYAIGATTLAFRVALFPLFVRGQRTSSRMAHMQPELMALKEELDKMGGKIDQQTQLMHVKKNKALFRKYDCNPFFAIVPPLVSAPIFMSMFFALRNAPEYFPELLSTGGMLWFPDLTVADPYCIMPVFSALLFLGITEVGKEQMMASDPVRGRTMVNAFRALAIVMVPLTMSFQSSVFVYWTTNNTFSFVQTMVLRQPSVRKYFEIWDPPKPIPGQELKLSIFDEIKNLTQKKKKKELNAWAEDRVKAHNEIIVQQRMVKNQLTEKKGLKPKG
ncbi:hypothetical protein ACHAW5_010298 [Stephanodiscus triporus]|uniref:Membrane insertase YidC/Oxa/ALB C-terminal domain-containing protein n=1 Tax=Stephanodiscus triporus TaxID=2934178 RepID=A0ABD3N4R9_9STRA